MTEQVTVLKYSDSPQKTPSRFHPPHMRLLYEDRDIILINKSGGLLTVGALWEKSNTAENLLSLYLKKGLSKSKAQAFVVHRLDQMTTGTLVFAKSELAQQTLKNNWKKFNKIYYAIGEGVPQKSEGLIQSYLTEDEDYIVHSSQDAQSGVLAETKFQVVAQSKKLTLFRLQLLTGKKNQIRVHLAEMGCPILGDIKYGQASSRQKNLFLHSYSLEFDHPYNQKRLLAKSSLPFYFQNLFPEVQTDI